MHAAARTARDLLALAGALSPQPHFRVYVSWWPVPQQPALSSGVRAAMDVSLATVAPAAPVTAERPVPQDLDQALKNPGERHNPPEPA